MQGDNLSLSQKVKKIEEERGSQHVFVFGPQFALQLESLPELVKFLADNQSRGLPVPFRFLRFVDEADRQHILMWLSDRNFLDHGGMMGKLGVHPTAIADAGVASMTGSLEASRVRFGGDNIIMRLYNAGGPIEIRRAETQRIAAAVAPENMQVTSSVRNFE